jgi:hypothetical protein
MAMRPSTKAKAARRTDGTEGILRGGRLTRRAACLKFELAIARETQIESL